MTDAFLEALTAGPFSTITDALPTGPPSSAMTNALLDALPLLGARAAGFLSSDSGSSSGLGTRRSKKKIVYIVGPVRQPRFCRSSITENDVPKDAEA